MAAGEEQTTDRHDEPDRTQFEDDPTHINGTHFINAQCTQCGTHVVTIPGHHDHQCIDCRRHQEGITWQSGDNIGNHHPTNPSVPRPYTLTPVVARPPATNTAWQWACIHCLETGTATNPTHAHALHTIHLGYACPAAPGISREETLLRLARRRPHERLYPQTTPPLPKPKKPQTRKP